MSDIFLSYAREDLAKAELLASALESQGWSVFWDRSSILPGEDFDWVIERAIENASCMIVLWSDYSKKSHYVRDEARLGRDRNILVPVLIDPVSAPLGFGSIHAESFSQWSGDTHVSEFRKLCGAVKRLVGDSRSNEQTASHPAPAPIKDSGGSNRSSAKVLEGKPKLAFEPEMIIIPAGSFQMGGKLNDSEQPIHAVTFSKPFGLGTYPVTFAEYDYFAEQTGAAKPDDEGWGRDRCPVINVSWQDACNYAAWLSLISGRAYRLPSEAEWEYACRAGSHSDFFWGDDVSLVNEYAWFEENNENKTHPVGEKLANHWGLHDMTGNVWEWVQDAWHEDYQGAPSDGSAWKSGNSPQRVIRGGSWYIKPGSLRSAYRTGFHADSRTHYFGFRLAQDFP